MRPSRRGSSTRASPRRTAFAVKTTSGCVERSWRFWLNVGPRRAAGPSQQLIHYCAHRRSADECGNGYMRGSGAGQEAREFGAAYYQSCLAGGELEHQGKRDGELLVERRDAQPTVTVDPPNERPSI